MGQPSVKTGEPVLLLITAIWGTTFLAIQDALPAWPPFVLMAARFAVASAMLMPFALLRQPTRSALRDGMALGTCAFAGFALQTVSLQYTSAAHTAFGTALVTVLVPLFSCLFLGAAWHASTVVGLVAASVGIGLLAGEQLEPGVRAGDALAVASAVAFAVQIILLERCSRRVPLLQLVTVEVVTTTALSGVGAWAFGESLPQVSIDGWTIVLYLGVVATAACLLGQVYGQSRTTATRAAFIYALEPIFAAAFAWSLRGQRLTVMECVGGGLVVFAAVTADRPIRRPLAKGLFRHFASRAAHGRAAKGHVVPVD